MSPPDGSTILTLNHDKAEEDRMRAALGLAPEPQANRPPGRRAHKPGAGNMVPVTVVSTRRPPEASDDVRARLATLTDAVNAERSERAAAQQALVDAHRAIQLLQTKLAHAEIAAAEAFEVEHAARLAAEARLLAITPSKAPKASQPKAELTELRRRGRPPKPRPATAQPAAPKKPGRPPGSRQAKEPAQKPVQWWLPSYKASKADRSRSKT